MQVKLPGESMWNTERVLEGVSHIHPSGANSKTLEFQNCHKKRITYFNMYVSYVPLSSVEHTDRGEKYYFPHRYRKLKFDRDRYREG